MGPSCTFGSRCTPRTGDLWLTCPAHLTLLHSPYHALLLLSDEKSLLGELPLDCSPALVRVIKTTSAVKNLQQLAQDADLALLQVLLWGPGETLWMGRMGWRRSWIPPSRFPLVEGGRGWGVRKVGCLCPDESQ